MIIVTLVVTVCVLVLAFLVYCVFALRRLEEKRLLEKRRRFMDRPPMRVDQIFEKFFAGAGLQRDAFLRLWVEIAELLNLDAERLRPTDRFDRELARVEGAFAEDEAIRLEELLRVRCKELKIDRRNVKPETLGDFVRICLAGRTAGEVTSPCSHLPGRPTRNGGIPSNIK